MGIKSRKNKKVAKRNPDANMMVVEVSGNRVIGEGNKVITDERFAQSQKDPRFQDAPRHKVKVAIDQRFSRMFTNKNFSTSSPRVDKRGRAKQDANSSQNALRHYYKMEDEQNKQKKQHQESDDEDDKDVERDNENGEYVSDDVAMSKSDPESESESESESLGEEDEEDITDDDNTSNDEEDEETTEEEENVPNIDKETHRLAIVKLDWSQFQAVDLFVVLHSFLPKTGQILSVSLYPTEFGLKRMKEEEVHSPVDLFDDEDWENELERYCYAVVVCESVATANSLYDSCSGVMFEGSSNELDIRFIPDSFEFKHSPCDVVTEAPANYEPTRYKKLNRKINVDEDEEQSKELFASSDSETDEDENHGKRKTPEAYRPLLQSGDEDDDKDVEDKGMEMEVTFNPGLENLNQKILEKKDKKSETVWAASLRKKKEKKKARKNKSLDSDREPVEESGDFFAGDSDRKREMGLDKEGEASKAELELLLVDDDSNVKGYNLKRKNSQGKKRKREGMDEEKIPSVDYGDPRFSSRLTRSDYALDPTDPQFKRSAALYVRQVAHRQHKGDLDRKGGQQLEESQASKVDTIDSKKDKHEISMLVKSVKMKSRQLSLPCNGNKSRRKGI